ncbi:hypothetical protein RhiirC2_801010 [Rhizophagus irregularis]|uniref:Uncharacterized protein n=1 Tax=Rhizophagus irregularis TaxID=588596 RepID=A0A2N1M2Y1_9GLOM|nr:hypothetical protein RhiirC2_801010 [Rhizophagus irregularis]
MKPTRIADHNTIINNNTHANTYPNIHHNPQDDNSSKRITQLEKQVQTLLQNIKTLEDVNSHVDKRLSHIQQNYSVLDSSLIEIKTRLDKYNEILKQLSTNITLLSKRELAATSLSPQPRPQKLSKRTSAEDSETFLATEEDTDVPEESIISDGAVFDDIITQHESTSTNDNNFSVRSYNPLNLISSFNGNR